MSWQHLIDNLEGKKCSYAVLASIDGNPWGESKNKDKFFINPGELGFLARTIKNNDKGIFASGLKLHSANFTCLILDDEVMILQGKGDFKDYSLVAAISIQAIVVGFNEDPGVKAACVRDAVESMKDYLKQQGF